MIAHRYHTQSGLGKAEIGRIGRDNGKAYASAASGSSIATETVPGFGNRRRNSESPRCALSEGKCMEYCQGASEDGSV